MNLSDAEIREFAHYIETDDRGPISQLRAYLAEHLIGLAMRIDSRATFAMSRSLTRLGDRVTG